jgi:hypothetical protein
MMRAHDSLDVALPGGGHRTRRPTKWPLEGGRERLHLVLMAALFGSLLLRRCATGALEC